MVDVVATCRGVQGNANLLLKAKLHPGVAKHAPERPARTVLQHNAKIRRVGTSRDKQHDIRMPYTRHSLALVYKVRVLVAWDIALQMHFLHGDLSPTPLPLENCSIPSVPNWFGFQRDLVEVDLEGGI